MGTATTGKQIGARAGGLASALAIVGVLGFGGASAANADNSGCPGGDLTPCSDSSGSSSGGSSGSSNVTTPAPNQDDASRSVNRSFGGIRSGAGVGGGMVPAGGDPMDHW